MLLIIPRHASMFRALALGVPRQHSFRDPGLGFIGFIEFIGFIGFIGFVGLSRVYRV